MTPSPSWQAPRSSGWMAPPGSSCGIPTRPRTPCRTRSSEPGVTCPRCAVPIASTPGSTGCWSAPASMRRAGSDAIASTSNSPRFRLPAVGDTDVGRSSTATSSNAASSGSIRRCGRVIVLHHYLDLPLPDGRSALGIPLGTAKSRLHRALGLMRAALDADARLGSEIRGGPSGMTTDDALRQHRLGMARRARPGIACPAISARCWRRRPDRDSGRGGRASKGGSPCNTAFTARTAADRSARLDSRRPGLVVLAAAVLLRRRARATDASPASIGATRPILVAGGRDLGRHRRRPDLVSRRRADAHRALPRQRRIPPGGRAGSRRQASSSIGPLMPSNVTRAMPSSHLTALGSSLISTPTARPGCCPAQARRAGGHGQRPHVVAGRPACRLHHLRRVARCTVVVGPSDGSTFTVTATDPIDPSFRAVAHRARWLGSLAP